jgi:hypothetical protein
VIRRHALMGVALLLAATLLTAPGCGDGTVKFGGVPDNEDDPVLTVAGDLDDIDVGLQNRPDIVAFAFTNLVNPEVSTARAAGLRCGESINVEGLDFTDVESVVITPDASVFSISDVASGDITVLFLLDNQGNDADRRIDAGDPVAILSDPDGDLENVRSKLTLQLSKVDIDFTAGTSSVIVTTDAPACAVADHISRNNADN